MIRHLAELLEEKCFCVLQRFAFLVRLGMELVDTLLQVRIIDVILLPIWIGVKGQGMREFHRLVLVLRSNESSQPSPSFLLWRVMVSLM